MRNWILGIAILGTGLFCGAHAALADDKPGKGDSIAWAKSFDEAMSQAKNNKTLVMVDFYTDWCGWCKKLDADTYTDKTVGELAKQFASVKVNPEKEGKAVGEKYKDSVRGYPTILFIDPMEADSKGGGIVGKIGGYMAPAGFSEQMKLVFQGFKDYPKLKEQLQADPTNVEVLGKMAVLFHQRSDDKRAAELLDQAEKLDPSNSRDLLTKAYNAVADSYQEARQFDKAITLFRKAAKTGKQANDIAYGLESVAACFFSQGKFKDAIPELESVLKIPGVSDADKAQAEQMMRQARQAGGK
jgi:pentatricopeptide repeat protein